MAFNKRIYFLTNIIIWINKCLTTKTLLKREILEQLTALLQPLVMSRREDTACLRDSLARLPNTPLPSLENMDQPRPQLLETTSSPRRNMKTLPPLLLLPTFPMLPRKNWKLLILMRMNLYQSSFPMEIWNLTSSCPKKMRRPMMN